MIVYFASYIDFFFLVETASVGKSKTMAILWYKTKEKPTYTVRQYKDILVNIRGKEA